MNRKEEKDYFPKIVDVRLKSRCSIWFQLKA